MENDVTVVDYENLTTDDLAIEGPEDLQEMVGEGELLQDDNSALTSPDYALQPLVDQNGNYYPWEYYQVIHDACAVAIQENITNDLTAINDTLEDVSLYSLGILSTIVLGGVVWFVKSLLSPKS